MKEIGEKQFKDIKKWFTAYIFKFKNGDENYLRNIILKEEHTLRVCNEILYIGKNLGLKNHELRLAETIALLHDIGRFEQYDKYRTFSDRKSEDHASLGLKILEKYNVLKDIDEFNKKLIFRTIECHNKASLPKNESNIFLFYIKLLRDADKLDIWKVVTDYYQRQNSSRNSAVELDLPDTDGFSESVYQDLIGKKIVDFSNIKNLNDFKLLQIGWIFDINFASTLRRIQSRRYLEFIRDVLPKSPEIQRVFNVVDNHLKQRLEEAGEKVF
ncbi:MAG: HD domain-containing protein [Calditrichaceae bacterium]|nr:HD domain-containing protein [Calditrichaceae bacterium]MBN2708222.1 HD domain-containing protein [Calditrichaceae bacterium]